MAKYIKIDGYIVLLLKIFNIKKLLKKIKYSPKRGWLLRIDKI